MLGNYSETEALAVSEVRAWLGKIYDNVAASALRELAAQAEPPGLGVNPDQTGPLLDEWMLPMVGAAKKVGEEAVMTALDGLIFGGLASSLAKLTRSQLGRSNGGKVKNRRGRQPAGWRVEVGKLFRNKILMNRLSSMEPGNEAQTIIDRAMLDEIIEERDGCYFDMRGNRIAASKAAMRSEISKIKGKYLKPPM